MDKVKLDTNKHSVYLLYCHLILLLKYRKKVIDERISNRLKEINTYACIRQVGMERLELTPLNCAKKQDEAGSHHFCKWW